MDAEPALASTRTTRRVQSILVGGPRKLARPLGTLYRSVSGMDRIDGRPSQEANEPQTPSRAGATPTPGAELLQLVWDRIGCSSLTFHDRNLEAALDLFHARGIRCLDIGVVPGHCDHIDPLTMSEAEIASLEAALRDRGLRVSSLNVYAGDLAGPDFEQPARLVEASIRVASRLGARILTLPPGRAVSEDSWLEKAQLLAKFVRPVLDQGEAAGLRVTLEAPHTFTLAEDCAQAKRLFEVIGDPRLGCTFDTSHVQRAAIPPSTLVDYLPEVGAEVVHVHLRDCVRGDITITPGKGECDYLPFLQALVAAGYQGDLNFELEYDRATSGQIERELEFAREHLRLLLSGTPLPFSHALYKQGWYRTYDLTRDTVTHPRAFVCARPRLKAALRPSVMLLRKARDELVPYAQVQFSSGWSVQHRVGRAPSKIAVGKSKAAPSGGETTKRVAVLGCGYTGYHMHGPGVARIPGLELVGVCDIDQEKADRLAQRLGCPAFYAAADMVSQTRPDLVVNCTREWTHYETTMQLFNEGVDVFCEKIMAEQVRRGDEMVRVAREKGRVLGMNFNWRFLPTIQKIREIKDSNELGDLRLLRIFAHSWVYHHALDLVRFLGGDVRTVSALIRDDPELRCLPTWRRKRASRQVS